MKRNFFRAILIPGVLLIFLGGCNQTKKDKQVTSEGKQTSVEVGVFDPVKMKDQIVEAINKLPSGKEITDLLNNAGASYIYDLTLSPDLYPKLLTQNQISLGCGMYFFDWLYSVGYNRNDKGAEFGKIIFDIRDKTGLKEKLTFEENYYGRIQANSDNIDSLNILVTEVINKTCQKLSQEENPLFYALTAIGGNIEALHIAFQQTLLATNNKELLEVINKQKERVETVYLLLEMMSGDETIKPFYEDLKPIVKAYQENSSITEEKLIELAPKIEALRNKLIQ